MPVTAASIFPSVISNIVSTSILRLARMNVPRKKALSLYRPSPRGCLSAGNIVSLIPSRFPNLARRQPSKLFDLTPFITSIRGCPSSVADMRTRFWRAVFSLLPIKTHSSPTSGAVPANSSVGTRIEFSSTSATSTQ